MDFWSKNNWLSATGTRTEVADQQIETINTLIPPKFLKFFFKPKIGITYAIVKVNIANPIATVIKFKKGITEIKIIKKIIVIVFINFLDRVCLCSRKGLSAKNLM